MQLTCLGEILIDLFPAELGRKLADVSAFYPKPGGAPANVAVAAARLGLQSAFIGKAGADAFGEHLRKTLTDSGVNVSGMRFDPQVRTTLAFIASPDEYHNEYIFYRNPGADLRLSPGELDQQLLRQTKALHIGSLSMVDEPARSATLRAIDIARSKGALISFDVNYRPSLWEKADEALAQIKHLIGQVDLLKLNETELFLLSGVQPEQASAEQIQQATSQLLAMGPSLVILTLGGQGSFYFTRQCNGFVPAFAVQTVDATGCGDAFIAGLLTRLLSSHDWRSTLTATWLQDALRFANAVGALTSLTKGVIPALPTAAQVEAFLSRPPQTVAIPVNYLIPAR